MAADDIARFRRMCGQFRWLAVFMVASVGCLLLLMHVVSPIVLGIRGDGLLGGDWRLVLARVIWGLPAACYLFAVWAIGGAMGQLARGRLIQPTLASALRRVGLALGTGGVMSVFVVTNLTRIIGETRGGFLHWDVAAMTLGMIGGALFLLGRVVDQADRVQAELDQMI